MPWIRPFHPGCAHRNRRAAHTAARDTEGVSDWTPRYPLHTLDQGSSRWRRGSEGDPKRTDDLQQCASPKTARDQTKLAKRHISAIVRTWLFPLTGQPQRSTYDGTEGACEASSRSSAACFDRRDISLRLSCRLGVHHTDDHDDEHHDLHPVIIQWNRLALRTERQFLGQHVSDWGLWVQPGGCGRPEPGQRPAGGRQGLGLSWSVLGRHESVHHGCSALCREPEGLWLLLDGRTKSLELYRNEFEGRV